MIGKPEVWSYQENVYIIFILVCAMPAVGSRTRKTFFLAFEFVTVITTACQKPFFLRAQIVFWFETPKVKTFPRKAHTLFIFKLSRYLHHSSSYYLIIPEVVWSIDLHFLFSFWTRKCKYVLVENINIVYLQLLRLLFFTYRFVHIFRLHTSNTFFVLLIVLFQVVSSSIDWQRRLILTLNSWFEFVKVRETS